MMEGVQMRMGALDCPICQKPFGPRIYQCDSGHLLCKSCWIRSEKCPTPLCPRTVLRRCIGMERIAEAIKVPCCFAKNGCTAKMAYFDKANHEKACQHRPCFCPEPGCGFTGTVAALRDHYYTGRHKWPSTAFEYYAQFDLRLRPGPHVLHAQDGSSVFLMPAEPLGHAAISLVCVQPEVSTDAKRSPQTPRAYIF